LVEGGVRRSSIRHVAALDGVRGAAVAAVVVFHGGHLLGGYLGVDLFFTLSGFLITSLLLAEAAQTGHVGLGGFWARRARRLLPALAVLMAGIVAYCVLFATAQELTPIRGDAYATLAYIANWRQVFSHQNYFALFNAPSPLQHTWSLAIEEQFYLIWPLTFLALLTQFKHATAKAVLAVSLTLAAISSVLMITLYKTNNTTRVYYGTDTRAAAILLGAALAAWLTIAGPTTNRHRRIALETLGIISAIGLAVAWTRLDGQSATLYRGGFLLCGLAATTIIATITHPQPGPLARVLSWKPLCQLGLISYGVYLYHWPIDIIANHKRVGLTGWPLLTTQAALTLTAAIASYHFIERPIRHGKLTTTQLRKLTPAITIALIAAIFTTTLGAKKPPTITVLSHPLIAATRAYRAAPPGSTRIMIVGDSVADLLAPGFQALNTKPPLTIFNAGVPGCHFPPELTGAKFGNGFVDNFVGVTKPGPCHPTWEPGAIRRFKPNIVFWILGDHINAQLRYGGQWIPPCAEPYNSLYQRALREEITRLEVGGARVVLTTAAYGRYYGYPAPGPTDCDNRDRRAVAAAMGIKIVDLGNDICPHGQCRVKQNGVTLRPDGEHYEGEGAAIVATWLVKQIEPLAPAH
jgi:peptidoglycan/LPS O-acetylase OafA/YrhL